MKNPLTLQRIKRYSLKKLYFPYLEYKTLKKLSELNKWQTPKTLSLKDCLDIAYLRTDFWLKGNIAGGAVAHTKGVVEAFIKLQHHPLVISGFLINYLNLEDHNSLVIEPQIITKEINELQELEYNFQLIKILDSEFKKRNFDVVYQRYGLNNYTGAFLSKKFNLPFILEYNGSEIWIAKHWKNCLTHVNIAEEIELANFNAADLIIVNAQALKDELAERGIIQKKILVIPNGVDPERFNPELDYNSVRNKLGISKEKLLVTFIGTFGRWHGAEIFAQSIKLVIQQYPDVHFMFIGEGATFPMVRDIIENDQIEDYVTLTGTIPQLDAPNYLGASDILISPQIPNPDGTPFFGSPTKLFEYMAAGKPIVASNLDQMGVILENEKTAILVTPGNVEALAAGILKLANSPSLRERLGMQARIEVINKYSWQKHVGHIIDHLKYTFHPDEQ